MAPRVAYVALRQGSYGLYRNASSGGGKEELLYTNNAPLTLTDWSQDGRYLTYFSSDLSGGGIYALPLAGTGERKPIEMYRSKSQVDGPASFAEQPICGLRVERVREK
jgi:hypothetical protein